MGTGSPRTTECEKEKAACPGANTSEYPEPNPDPSFGKGLVSTLPLSAESGLVDYAVALLVVFLIVGLVVYFARADKATNNRQPDPIPAKETG
jgi:hypothetical protein